jgi:hypothetical protein
MKFKHRLVFSTILATAALGNPAAAHAQSDPQKKTPPAKHAKPAAKPHKVWTDDEVGSLRSPANAYMDAKYSQADAAADSKEASAAVKPKPHVAAPALSNPKTVDDADKMIAWEKRDVDAQTEYVERLKKQIDEASQEDKERLKKVLQERIQILADTRGEMETLVQQKKELQKKAATESNNAAAQPPSQ